MYLCNAKRRRKLYRKNILTKSSYITHTNPQFRRINVLRMKDLFTKVQVINVIINSLMVYCQNFTKDESLIRRRI